MAKVAAKVEESRRAHPTAWGLGIELADECFAERTPYLLQNIQTEDDVNRYIQLAAEHVVMAVAEGEIELGEALTCGIPTGTHSWPRVRPPRRQHGEAGT
jgi:hypothetical protein